MTSGVRFELNIQTIRKWLGELLSRSSFVRGSWTRFPQRDWIYLRPSVCRFVRKLRYRHRQIPVNVDLLAIVDLSSLRIGTVSKRAFAGEPLCVHFAPNLIESAWTGLGVTSSPARAPGLLSSTGLHGRVSVSVSGNMSTGEHSPVWSLWQHSPPYPPGGHHGHGAVTAGRTCSAALVDHPCPSSGPSKQNWHPKL